MDRENINTILQVAPDHLVSQAWELKKEMHKAFKRRSKIARFIYDGRNGPMININRIKAPTFTEKLRNKKGYQNYLNNKHNL